jgi:uncharacterized SAM-binding protein YcdF (DUF218 family)
VPRHVNDTRKSFYGPGALSSFVLACLTTVLGLGVPVLWRLRKVMKEAGQDEQAPADLIVVLGRHLERDQASAMFKARLDHGAALWRRGLAPRIVVTGGMTGAATRTEAEVGREYLVSAGVPAEAVLCEDRSRHTLENLYNVRELLAQKGWTRVLMVSDAFHLVRAAAHARGFGLDVVCSPAPGAGPSSRVATWGRALNQAFMLHWYHTGVAYSRLIRSRRLLERVT